MKYKLSERKLTSSELERVEDIVKGIKKNKSQLYKRYGKDAEKVMYGRATKLAKKDLDETIENLNVREVIKKVLQNPKKADLNKDEMVEV